MSTLPMLASDRYRRNSISERPQKVGGIFSLRLGQTNGPFLDKDFHLKNKKSIGLLTTRCMSRRNSFDGQISFEKICSASYTTYPKNLAFIPQEVFQAEEIQTFRNGAQIVNQQMKVCRQKLYESDNQIKQIRSEMKQTRRRLEEELDTTNQQILSSFRELRTKLFDFSRHENNTHLSLVKRQTASFQQALNNLKVHYEFAEQKFTKLHKQFKGRETKTIE